MISYSIVYAALVLVSCAAAAAALVAAIRPGVATRKIGIAVMTIGATEFAATVLYYVLLVSNVVQGMFADAGQHPAPAGGPVPEVTVSFHVAPLALAMFVVVAGAIAWRLGRTRR